MGGPAANSRCAPLTRDAAFGVARDGATGGRRRGHHLSAALPGLSSRGAGDSPRGGAQFPIVRMRLRFVRLWPPGTAFTQFSQQPGQSGGMSIWIIVAVVAAVWAVVSVLVGLFVGKMAAMRDAREAPRPRALVASVFGTDDH